MRRSRVSGACVGEVWGVVRRLLLLLRAMMGGVVEAMQ